MGLLAVACADEPGPEVDSPTSSTPSASGAPSPTETSEEDPDEAGEAWTQLSGLDQPAMTEVLLSSGDLDQVPDGHTTHSGVGYFNDHLVENLGYYEETFGDEPCAVMLDSLNGELVGEDPQEGLLHEYTFTEGGTMLLYAWALSYEEPVDREEVWEQLQEQCGSQELSAGSAQVEIEFYEQDSFRGTVLRVETPEQEAVARSAAVAAGENLIMISAVNIDAEEFDDAIQRQGQKLQEYAETAAAN